MTVPRSAPLAYALADREGGATWFVGTLMIRLAGGPETRGAFDLLDQTAPPGFAPPRHVHRHEDEAWYVLEGAATFWCGEQEIHAEKGAFVFLPRDIEHAFKVGPSGARLLTLAVPSGFAEFVRAAGEPARSLVVPPPGDVDQRSIAEIAARFGIEITGPPPQ
ncbi:MAG: quercetin 2,3-dioxygenase [Candidatus Limnocylindria bacterium]